jgi:cobalt-zinc-cadmium resistance protein CzcA
MIRKIVSFAIHRPPFLILALVLFIGAGIAAFHGLPIKAFPDVTDVQVSVITLFPGHAPDIFAALQRGNADASIGAAIVRERFS